VKEAIAKNLKSVRAESHRMLANIKAVRGEKYHDAVHYLLVSTQVAETVSHLHGLASQVEPDVAKILAFAVSENLSSAATLALESIGLSDGEMQECLADAKRINESTYSLIESAIDAGRNGSNFGGADA
jgi:hypothetical protein